MGYDFDTYLKKQEEENKKALAEQSAKTNAAFANALGSAAVEYNDTKAIATSGGIAETDSAYKPITAESLGAAQQPAAQPEQQTEQTEPEKGHYDADNDPANNVEAKPQQNVDLPGMLTQEGDIITGSDGKQYKKLPDGTLALITPADNGGANTPSEGDTPAESTPQDNGEPKSFDQMVSDYYSRMKDDQSQMKAQEEMNMYGSMANGATELAAGIINMLSVGQLHASNQQYKDFSSDWMKKADEDMKERRRRHQNMQDTYERLKKYQFDLRKAESLEQLRAQQKAEADAKAEEKAKKERDAVMLRQGFVPDENEPSGYRFDQELFDKMHPVKQKESTVTYKSDKKTNSKTTAKDAKDAPVAPQKPGSSLADELRGGSSNYRNQTPSSTGQQKQPFNLAPSYLDRWVAEQKK